MVRPGRSKIAALALGFGLVAVPASAAPIVVGNHAYEYIATNGLFSFAQANAAAQAATFNGVNGHLVTILSAAENAIVLNLIAAVQNSVWIGASDAAVEGEWRWVTGEQFWQGGAAGTTGPDVFYANWDSGQPDNFGASGQHVATIFGGSIAQPSRAGRWDDGSTGGGLGNGIFQRDGYVVEFDAVVPEPATLFLLGSGLAAVAGRRRTKRPT